MGEKKQVSSITDAKERDQAFEMARGQIEKQFGKGSILRLGENTVQNIGTIPSGSLILDRALGVGGYPRGRIIEIFGPESSGKTTLALHAIAEAQKLGGTAAFIDAEHAIDPKYAKALGVDVDKLWVSQPDNGEQALEITEHLVRSGAVDIIVIDSVAALTPKAEIAGVMGDAQMGNQARLMSQALRKLTGIISKTSCSLIFINQIRMKIGVMFGSPETTTGGNALKFYATVRIDIRRVDRISQGAENYIGNKVRVKIAKNKVAPPFKEATFAIYFGKGISREENILDLAVDHDLVQKTGSWYTVGEQRIQGKEASIQYLAEHPDYGKELESKIRSIVFTGASAATTPETSSDNTNNVKKVSDETNTVSSKSETSSNEGAKTLHAQKKIQADDQA